MGDQFDGIEEGGVLFDLLFEDGSAGADLVGVGERVHALLEVSLRGTH
jgi:hypothetical protein